MSNASFPRAMTRRTFARALGLAAAIGTMRAKPALADLVLGIDVSRYQGQINWDAVAQDVQFAYLKGTNGVNPDPNLSYNFNAVRSHSMPVGFYHYFRFDVPADQQAQAFVGAVGKPVTGDLPFAVDIEATLSGWNPSSQDTAEASIRTFLNTIALTDSRPAIIYTNQLFWDNELKITDDWSANPLWISNYNNVADPPIPASSFKAWLFWQYSNAGSVQGINGKVDMTQFKGSLTDLSSLRLP